MAQLLARNTCFFVCDVQERFRSLIWRMPGVIKTSSFLVDSAKIMSIPVITTEQYPEGLGHTVPEITLDTPAFTKSTFSMMTPDVWGQLRGTEARSVVLFGLETHVCVLQTALDLLDAKYDVHVVVDGVSSQRQGDRDVGLQRLGQEGAKFTTAESVVFQLMGSSNHPKFRDISSLLKKHNAEFSNNPDLERL